MSGQTVTNLDISQYDKREIEMMLQFVDGVKNPNKISQMVSNDLIRKKVGDGSKFPPNLQVDALIKLRNDNIPQIFKKVFETKLVYKNGSYVKKVVPSGLSDSEIEN